MRLFFSFFFFFHFNFEKGRHTMERGLIDELRIVLEMFIRVRIRLIDMENQS